MALIDQVADQCGLFISDLKAQDNYSVIAEILTQIDSDSFPAVSYTHLDVYKRQLLPCPAPAARS